MSTAGNSPDSVDVLEAKLIGGATRWIADIHEFFRDYRINDTTFSLYAKGRTRNKGLFLSRFFSWTVLPDYTVSLFCVDEKNTSLNVEILRKRMDSVLRVLREDELKWVWLILLSDRELSPQLVSFVTRYDKRELGIVVGSRFSGQVVSSNNQVGQSIKKHLGLDKLLRVSRNWKN